MPEIRLSELKRRMQPQQVQQAPAQPQPQPQPNMLQQAMMRLPSMTPKPAVPKPAPKRKSLVDDKLLDAIALQESWHNPKAVGDNGTAFGAFQLRKSAFKDVQRIYPKEFGKESFDRVKTDPAFNRLIARRYLEAFEGHYGITDMDRLISAYNAGPRSREGALVNPDYVARIQHNLQKMGDVPMTQLRLMNVRAYDKKHPKAEQEALENALIEQYRKRYR